MRKITLSHRWCNYEHHRVAAATGHRGALHHGSCWRCFQTWWRHCKTMHHFSQRTALFYQIQLNFDLRLAVLKALLHAAIFRVCIFISSNPIYVPTVLCKHHFPTWRNEVDRYWKVQAYHWTWKTSVNLEKGCLQKDWQAGCSRRDVGSFKDRLKQ